MTYRIGWITHDFPKRPSRRSVWLRSGAMVTMRFRNPILYLNRMGFHNEFYKPHRRYDAVIVIKAFHDTVLEEVKHLQQQGTPVIFDANVNYYKIWGDYPDPRMIPTPQQQRAALDITTTADYVIADSEYIRDVVRDYTSQVQWIPDNVLPGLFSPAKHRATAGKLRLIWSGMAYKSNELRLIREPLAAVDGVELWLVTNRRPPVMDYLRDALPVRWFRYHDLVYAWLLRYADAIVSPRVLNNGYNLGHTEYKITPGMARSLPALVSPQPSYVTAVGYQQGGMICYTMQDWEAALIDLRDNPAMRLAMGQRAAQTVQRHYATPVIAQQLAGLLQTVIGKKIDAI